MKKPHIVINEYGAVSGSDTAHRAGYQILLELFLGVRLLRLVEIEAHDIASHVVKLYELSHS